MESFSFNSSECSALIWRKYARVCTSVREKDWRCHTAWKCTKATKPKAAKATKPKAAAAKTTKPKALQLLCGRIKALWRRCHT